ncbi:MAG: sigma-54 dependent transcriptional regulator [Myxococcota bacterium]|nr:sigma-54 dependent transcriptional regulator [Myxococcota bacterium]
MIPVVISASIPKTGPPFELLVIDDEESMRHLLGVVLTRAGYRVHTVSDGEAGLDFLRLNPQVIRVLCDVRMPRLDGLGFLQGLAGLERQVYTVMMSAYGSMDLAIEAMKEGATDYISKPFKNDEILLVFRKLEERERLRHENDVLRKAVNAVPLIPGLVGSSPQIRSIIAAIGRVAEVSSTVLLTGESGTGKEVVARAIHDQSSRGGNPFVAVNCAAIPENLLESELFGHVRGAFTGAVRAKKGLFEEAHQGTLLLDEVGDMPLTLQVKLLRALESREIRPVGGSQQKRVDVRVIAATASRLAEAVAEKRFREDLFYRLNVVELHLPPLREREGDVSLLVAHFLAEHSVRAGRALPRLSREVEEALGRYSWPGNVRQLQNVMERAVVLAKDGTVEMSDLPRELLEHAVDSEADTDLSIKRRLPQLEKALIRSALKKSGGNRSQAAKLLEISYKALLYKIRDYGLEEA